MECECGGVCKRQECKLSVAASSLDDWMEWSRAGKQSSAEQRVHGSARVTCWADWIYIERRNSLDTDE